MWILRRFCLFRSILVNFSFHLSLPFMLIYIRPLISFGFWIFWPFSFSFSTFDRNKYITRNTRSTFEDRRVEIYHGNRIMMLSRVIDNPHGSIKSRVFACLPRVFEFEIFLSKWALNKLLLFCNNMRASYGRFG